MKKSLFFLLLLAQLHAQTSYGPFQVALEEIVIDGAPALQSFAWGTEGADWLLAGGVTNGVHDQRPPFSFKADDRNTFLYVMNCEEKTVFSAPLNTLPPAIAEQLSSSNMEFIQSGEWLYLFGGYGYDSLAGDWITHPKLTVVHVPGAIAAIRNGTDLSPHFRQIENEAFAVTGGQVGLIAGEFFLVGGQRFDGRYNPRNMPSFVQKYSDAIRRFRISDTEGQLTVEGYSETVNAQQLHRRDYNMLPQVFPDGAFGFTVFSGVFRPEVDLPWLHSVDVGKGGYAVITDFQQLFNQYHTAHLPVYDRVHNAMHSLFFGGIGLYFVSAEGEVLLDSLVPFVKHVSMVTRTADGALSESILELGMPGFLGASAEFIPVEGIPEAGAGVVDLNALPEQPTLVGHIFGGIEATQPNVFMQPTGSSDATNRIFRVLLQKDVAGGSFAVALPSSGLLRQVYTNPEKDTLLVEGAAVPGQALEIELTDGIGSVVNRIEIPAGPDGKFDARLGLKTLSKGIYFLSARAGELLEIKRIVVD